MITYQREPYPEEEIYRELCPLVRGWFKKKFGKFALPQRYAIINIHRRENTLVSAPTGSGKTLTAFLSIINELIILSEKGELEDKVYCLYVSPLKALNNDIEKNLKEPLNELREMAGRPLGIRVAVRTGDTTSSAKARMLSKPPHILITTPETLSIILNAPRFRQLLRDVKWVIVDEIHALAENKRGVHLSLSLERLQNLAGNFTRIALSATIAPLEEVAKFLVGYENSKPRDCKIVDVQFLKKLDLKVLTPVPNLMNTTQEELHDSLYDLLDKLISEHRTTLIFTNTRSGTERVVHNLKTRFPEKYSGNIGAHHSSLSRSHRLDIENRLKSGQLKCVVSSTSLELGIDIGYIDLVILLGSPKSVARALQRVGRSGHKLHDIAKGRIIVMDRDDLVECSVLMKNAIEGKIDKIHIPENALDVLAQHIYGIAIEGRQNIDNVYSLVRRSYCYRNLSRKEFDSVLDYLAGKYMGLEERNVYAKIWVDKETGMMGRRSKMARVLYSTNVGTIPDESYIKVKVGNHSVGKIEEEFLERLRKGDIFVLGGNVYEFRYARGQTAQVIPADGRIPTVPSWFSEQLPLSFDLALEVGRFRRLVEERLRKNESRDEIIKFIHQYLYVDENSANSLYEYINEQYRYAKIPHDKRILIEFYRGFNRKYVIFHALFGRRVNDALSRAIAYLVSKKIRRDVMISLTDNGFYLSYDGKIPILRSFNDLLSLDLREVLIRAIDKTETLNRRFRHCATRSLMILREYKGRRKSVGRQQVGSKLLLNFVKKIPDFPILKEARREVLEDFMDVENCEKVLEWVREGRIRVDMISTRIPSPFALNLIAQGYMDVLRMEDRLEFIKRLHRAILREIQTKNEIY
ncbi:MAG: ATP-dependent helicase [Candidatus Altiarchaeales archaeon]|nr:MAG: ATP-dependent helicase [Candidatus Altiarchaeales archaeon]RLI94150.1 MAG: ATP-dependent helicase [Candidatus Altiarchaeales archaeon]RLI95209.1 MAG: ATP-dependent helicase [Candidatus Altiarchaeales archaeon]HDO82325.1 ATP-dependent helicase [Candidatus Altiarchaeales archaeon]HEX54974.1 ATP-dependent helicase [Candidatus Altiarchaeales archaeon]